MKPPRLHKIQALMEEKQLVSIMLQKNASFHHAELKILVQNDER